VRRGIEQHLRTSFRYQKGKERDVTAQENNIRYQIGNERDRIAPDNVIR
jgi:hypothetical protein